MTTQRRDILKYTLAAAAASALPAAHAQAPSGASAGAAATGIDPRDRVFITNEDSNTLVVIDPKTNTVESTINLTSFDEDPRPPFRYVTAGVAPTHAAMIHKPLYHGCIDAHGAVPSPDGRFIAYTGYDSTDATWKDAIMYVMDADGKNARALTEKLDRSPSGMIWASDASGVYFNVENEGSRNLYFVSLKGAIRQVTKGTHVLTVSDINRNFMAVGVATSPMKPNDIVTFDVRTLAMEQLTDVNADVLAGKQLATTEEVWYTSVDGQRIQGWIVKPAGFDAKKKYPLMLEIHGGPHSMYNVGFNFARQDHASNGFVMLYTNPRGSTGYGSAFGNAIKNAYPGKDYNDLMAGVDTVINRGFVDSNRLYVFGCSGGGVLTAWTVGHTDRFAAAASQCPVINWLSFVGTTDGSSWYYNFAKYPWDDPSEHLKRSPLMYVGNVKTPTMLMTGVNDLRTPIGQTEEFYEALKIRKVPTAMIRFNNEWHGTSSTPSNFIRTQLYLRSWFDTYQTPPKGQRVTPNQQ